MERLSSRALPSAFWGLFCALLLLLGLGLWATGQSAEQARRDAAVRKATVAAVSLSDLVAAAGASAPVTTDRLSTMVDALRGGDADIRTVRIVERAGGRLLYTTDPADLDRGAPPRRLLRAEKALFDLPNALRGNMESNAAEALARLPELDVVATEGGIQVTAPVVVGGDVWGAVQVERARTDRAGASGLVTAVLIAGAALAAMFVLCLATAGFTARAPRLGRWLLAGCAAILLLAAGTAFLRMQTAGIGQTAADAVQEIATVQADLRRTAAPVAAADLAGRVWDVDVFRRPHGQITADDTVDLEAVTVQAARIGEGLAGQVRIALGLSLLLLSVVALGGARWLSDTVRENRLAYAYVMPAMLGMLVLVFFPFLYGLALSFTDRTLVNQSVPLMDLWVGLDNYIRILGDTEVFRRTAEGLTINYESFYWTFFITVCWTVTNVAIGVSLGLALALVLHTENLRGRAIYRVLLILPWAIPNYITALIWKGMFHPQFGVINQVIVMFGGEPVQWFDSVFTSFVTGVVANGWLSFPFMMVICLGALAAIPSDMYEAARLDGASRWQQFWKITLPLLKPALVPAIILSVVWTFNMFNVIYLVSAGEPGGANEILITKAYKLAFERYQYAYAAAYSIVIFLILLVYGVFQNRATRATEAVA